MNAFIDGLHGLPAVLSYCTQVGIGPPRCIVIQRPDLSFADFQVCQTAVGGRCRGLDSR